ncbi:hypothetical protein B0T18DRAFT_426919 [Schizothecium vesticola]|uniref:Uncharacterized protein n=1 Tax=Schizothecium vesticola TaxID=314040 RepID=A0AA40F746_9PEZI|nr:hypothetical protein B0T18DRAFT_426919 [Schizothecium vesticola]
MRSAALTLLPALAAASQVHHPHVPRQTSSPGASACLASIESVVSSFPTIPRELVGITDIKPITDPCNYTPPATMATAFSSFQSVVVSWVSENWPKVTAVVEQCPEVKVDVEGFEKAWDILLVSRRRLRVERRLVERRAPPEALQE